MAIWQCAVLTYNTSMINASRNYKQSFEVGCMLQTESHRGKMPARYSSILRMSKFGRKSWCSTRNQHLKRLLQSLAGPSCNFTNRQCKLAAHVKPAHVSIFVAAMDIFSTLLLYCSSCEFAPFLAILQMTVHDLPNISESCVLETGR